MEQCLQSRKRTRDRSADTTTTETNSRRGCTDETLGGGWPTTMSTLAIETLDAHAPWFPTTTSPSSLPASQIVVKSEVVQAAQRSRQVGSLKIVPPRPQTSPRTLAHPQTPPSQPESNAQLSASALQSPSSAVPSGKPQATRTRSSCPLVLAPTVSTSQPIVRRTTGDAELRRAALLRADSARDSLLRR
ncbi:hypothetical protein MKEN_00118900 [Mycena kentingensis (nom. inval.)]|nr:hypothetical protein MKEN_00118900 [Mycena kentingensis (nom. inval.)]